MQRQSGWATSAVAGSSKAKDGAGTSNESTSASSTTSTRRSSETDGWEGAPSEGRAAPPGTTYLRRKSTMSKAQEEAEAKKAQWKIEGGDLVGLHCRMKTDRTTVVTGRVEEATGDRYFTIREGNTNSTVYEGKLHHRVDKDIVSVSLPYGDWGLAPEMHVRIHRPADTKEPYHEAVIEHVFSDGIIQSKGKESNSVSFVKKEAVTPKMSDLELSLLEGYTVGGKVLVHEGKGGNTRKAFLKGVFKDKTAHIKYIHGEDERFNVKLKEIVPIIEVDGPYMVGGRCRFSVEEGKWLNGVIEAMFVDLSVIVRESESKMVHTDIQRPQVNPVMPKGIDAYKKDVFCRYKYGEDLHSGTIVDVYLDGCCAIKALSETILYEVPAKRVIPSLPEGLGGHRPGVVCRAVVGHQKQDAKIVHVMSDETVAVVPKGKSAIVYDIPSSRVNPVLEEGKSTEKGVKAGSKLHVLVDGEYYPGECTEAFCDGTITVKTVGANGIGTAVKHDVGPDEVELVDVPKE